jgi:arylsulfatase
MAEMLKKQGYATAVYGKWHLGDAPENLPLSEGFDDFFGIPYSNDMWPYHPQQESFNFGPLPLYEDNQIIDTLEDQSFLTTAITERSVEFIDKNKDQPFFLYVAHPQPHVPLFVSDKFKGKSDRGLYGDVIMEIDWSVGEILDALERNGLANNTLVIFTSDNGPWLSYGDHAGSAGPFREGKGTAFEGGHREPFIARFPGKLPPGKIISTPVMAIDILPTVAELTGASLPELPIDGKNVWPVLTGETDVSPQPAYFFYYHVNQLHGVRYGNWKMYFPHVYRTLSGRPGGSGGLPAPYDYIKLEEVSLYDLENDPSETMNVANDYPDIVQKINHLADSIRHELGDALTGEKGVGSRDFSSQ